MQVVVAVRVEFLEARLQLAQRQEPRSRDGGRGVFVGLAHIDHLDAQFGIRQGAFEVLYRDFVNVH